MNTVFNLISTSLRMFWRLYIDMNFLTEEEFCAKYAFYMEGMMEENLVDMSDAYNIIQGYVGVWNELTDAGDVMIMGHFFNKETPMMMVYTSFTPENVKMYALNYAQS